MKPLFCIGLCLLLSISGIRGQEQPKKLTANGYLKSMQSVWIDTAGNWTSDNLLHNRLNFAYHGSKGLRASLEVRNRLLYGELVSKIPQYGKLLEADRAWIDMSWTLGSGPGYALHTYIDRAYIDYTMGKWQCTLGRQRINWGQNLIWNPNDLFNAFSFFDFDYEERPGTDALRIQRYTGPASVADLVISGGDSLEEVSVAGRYLGNWKGYDMQVLGGLVGGDMVAGLGWSGDIKGAGFRGEGSAFIPTGLSPDSSANPQYVASLSADYTFSKGLYLHAGFLYNSSGTTGKAGGYTSLMNSDLSAKMLSPARWALFLQASRQVSPLLTAGAAAIINPLDGSAFLGPSITFSLADEVDALLSSQIFLGEEGSEFGDYGSIWFLRVRWSF